MGPVRRKVERLLLRGMQSGNADARGMCRELYEHRQWLWTFLHHEGVEPTNNAGERVVASCGDLAEAVVWDAERGGSRFVETMLTVIETCRQQRRNAFAFITAAVEAHLAHQSSPFIALQGVNGYVKSDRRFGICWPLTTGPEPLSAYVLTRHRLLNSQRIELRIARLRTA